MLISDVTKDDAPPIKRPAQAASCGSPDTPKRIIPTPDLTGILTVHPVRPLARTTTIPARSPPKWIARPSATLSNPLGCLNVKNEDIDDVVVAGGSTRTPKVQSLLKNFFNSKNLLMESIPIRPSALQGSSSPARRELTSFSPSTSAPRLSVLRNTGSVFTKIMPRLSVLDDLRITKKPTASAIAYGLAQKNIHDADEAHIIVYDIGGGTFDASPARSTSLQCHFPLPTSVMPPRIQLPVSTSYECNKPTAAATANGMDNNTCGADESPFISAEPSTHLCPVNQGIVFGLHLGIRTRALGNAGDEGKSSQTTTGFIH
ncbi:hypothetical protein M407DRAFT_34863 [Tulasnella calospora MUT 4182]|uniref:HSP70-domain-containing protein n=1 Tax=Tulasnella calospora MUT 4182 TaxID=1051891 RepID=A0A0C3Q0M6_9AGAM|nr:hypothetical protein M407DRAFT_34863 [Tulasnella calospora MUT 4182]